MLTIGAFNAGDEVRIRIFTDGTNDRPGSSLYVLTNPGTIVNSQSSTFTAPAGATLQPDTKYHIVADAPSGGYGLRNTASNAEDASSQGDWSINDEFRFNSGFGWNTTNSNSLSIQVNGTVKAATSTDATLSDLDLTWDDSGTATDITLSPTFATATTAYTASVANGVSQITVAPTANDSNADCCDYLDGSDSALTDADTNATGFQVDLAEGANTIKVKVTAEDTSTTETYTVTVTRAGLRVWDTVLTIGVSGTARGFQDHGGTVFGSLDDTAFEYLDNTRTLQTLAASSAYGVILRADSGGETFGGLVLEWAGETLPLDDATRNGSSFTWNGAWLTANASSLAAANYAATLPDTGSGRVCLRTATADCPATTITVSAAATGKPGIDGTPQVGQTLTATAGDMADADNLPTTTFPDGYSFQWVQVDGGTETNIGTDSHEYDPVAADVGKTIKVEVTFTDGGGTEETLTSDETAAVVAAQGACPAGNDWCATMTVAKSVFPAGIAWGFSTAPFGALSETDINYGGVSYSVSSLQLEDLTNSDPTVKLHLDAFVPGGTVFNFGGTTFTADTGKQTTTGQYEWDSPANFAWLDGQKVTVSANLAPIVTGATVDGDQLVLTFAEDLDTTSKPAAGAFTVTVDGGADATPASVDTISGMTVTMTLASAVTSAQAVTVAYAPPATNPLQDTSGTDAPAFAAGDFTVTNDTAANNAPTVANAIPDQSAPLDTPFSYAFPANTFEDADGDPLTYTATKADDSALPSWLGFTAATRTFAGTPAATDAGTLSVKVTASDGTASVSDVFDIKVAATDVCDRTLQVRAGIVDAVTGVNDCADLTPAHLAAITGTLNLRNKSISSLAAGDFAGLTKLEVLALHGNSLPSLPAGVFDELAALTQLYLHDNSLPSLPAGVFDELVALTQLYLHDNSLTSLPDDIFNQLTALHTLWLQDNDLSTLPDDVFDQLTKLNNLGLQSNPGAPFRPTAGAGADQTVATGASVTLPGTVTGAWGDNVTWQWTQVDGPASDTEITSGAVTLDDDAIAGPSFTAPATAATLHFKLVVTPHPGADASEGRASGADWVTVTVAAASTDATLSDLDLTWDDSGTATEIMLAPAFDTATTSYTASVAHGVSQITIAGTKNDDGAEVTYLDGADNTLTDADTNATGFQVALAEGANTIKVKVTAEDTSTTETYTVTVTRAANNAPTGKPGITGTPQVGQTLTATAGDMADADNLPTTTFPDGYSFQWVRVDADGVSNPTDVGADSEEYMVVAADLGKKLKVVVTFTDGGGTEETLESDATDAVGAQNSAPTGAVTIDGGAAARVGRPLTAKTDTIDDADGLTAPGFSYSWFHQDAPGTELGTGQVYTPVASDEGKAIQVRVTFTDDAGFEETLTSAATTAVSPAPVAPSDAVWSATLTPALRDPGLLRERLGCLTGGDPPQRCSNPAVLSEDEFTHAGTDYVIWSLVVFTGDGLFQIDLSQASNAWAEAAQRLTLVIDGEAFPFADADGNSPRSIAWSNSGLEDILVAGTPVPVWLQAPANHPAGGAPGIDGTPQVDQTLTATKGDIADADNLPETPFPDGYSFQWVRVDADGMSNPTNVGLDREDYTVVAADLGKKLKVEVTFTDGGFTEETRTSAETAAVVAAQGACPAGNDWCETMTAEKSVAGSVTTFGYDSSDSLGSLTSTAIVYGGTTYTVSSLQVTDTSGSRVLAIDLDVFAPHGSVFDIGGTEFTADTASETSTTGQYRWAGVADPGWLDGQQVRVSANLAPVVTGATVDDDQLVLTFAEDLDTTSKPAADAFTVSVDGGADAAPASVDTISGKTVTLTLAAAVTSGQAVTIAYEAPTTNPLQDASGIEAPDFDAGDGDFTVTNNTGVGNNAPTVANAIPDQVATVGAAFSYAFPANAFEDADSDPLTYTATKADDNALPSWLGFTAGTRTFAGNPAAADVGTLSVKVTASDGAASVSDEFDIKVATNTAPTVANAIPDQAATVDTVFSYAYPANTFEDADGDPLTYTATKADDNALPSWLTFTAGTRTFAGTPAAADAGTVSVKVTASDGTASVSDEFDIKVAATDVCNRTAQVRDAIVAAVSGVTDCADLTPAHLAAITGSLDFLNSGISSLDAGDFAGLTGLTALFLNLNGLSSLPAHIFDELTALKSLDLNLNSLSSLPADIFDELTALTSLDLGNNSLSSLPEGIFDELTGLTRLLLHNNSLSSLPEGIFDELTALTVLYLGTNSLSSLPEGIFGELTALTDLQLQGNTGAPFSPTASAGADQTVVTGASVTLSGTATGAWGDNVTWQWTQVDGATSDTEVTGGAVTLDDDAIAAPSFTAPATAATLYFKLVVTPHPGADATYGRASAADRVTVTVASADATLSDLDLTWDDSGTDTAITLSPTFDKATTSYTASVANGVSRITVAPTANDSGADCCDFLDDTDSALTDADTNTTGFQVDLDEGDNTIKVVVTAEDDNTTATYTVTVTRAAANNAPTVANAIPDQAATVDAPFSYAFPADTFEDADGDNLTYTATKADDNALPSWLGFTAGTRTFAGTPAATDAGTVSVKVTASDGTASVSDTFDIKVAATDVCNRTPQVRDAIVAAVSGVDDCADLTPAHLAAITGTLDLRNESISSLAAGDFAGLIALETLRLDVNSLSSLPTGIFDPLTALQELDLGSNDLSSLPAGIFDQLTKLTDLGLYINSLSSLPAGVFDQLTGLTGLWLYNNDLSSLPDEIFDDLTALTDLGLQDNPGAPFSPTANAGADQTVVTGASVTLAGTATGAWGDNVTWQWTQVDGPASNIAVTGGGAVTLDDDAIAAPSFTAPATAATLHFKLVVTPHPGADTSAGRTGAADWVTVSVAATDATLSELDLTWDDGGTDTAITLTPTFASATTSYTADVANGVSRITVAPTANDSNADCCEYLDDSDAALTDADTNTAEFDVDLDVGANTVKVKVTAEDTSTTETYTVTVTRAAANNPAEGKPRIRGTPQVGQTLTATAGNMADDDNLPTTTFPTGYSFQWVRVNSSNVETDISTATARTYDPLAADVGKTIKVEVTFTDGGGTEETLTSTETAAVVAAQGACPADNDWCAEMTVGIGSIGGVTLYGYRGGGGISAHGSLDDAGIEYGGESWTVSRLRFEDHPGLDTHVVELDAFVPRGTVFDIGGAERSATLASEDANVTGTYSWPAFTNPGWLDGQKVTVSANLAPFVTEAAVDGDQLALTFAEDLDPSSKPAPSAFTVAVDGGAGAAPSSVDTISGKTVTLTLATAVTSAQTVTVAYTVPTSNPLRDDSHIEAPAFAAGDFTVTNHTGLTNTAPTVANAIPDQAATVDAPFSYAFPADTFEDADGDNLTYTATRADDSALPSWLGFTAGTRTFAGTPAATDAGTLSVKVTANDGTASVSDTFDITVAATDATLSELDLTWDDGGTDTAITLSPTFASATTSYTADVANGVSRITVAPTANDSGADCCGFLDDTDSALTDADTNTTGFQVDLTEGANTIKVKVTAEDGNTTQTYTVVVTRAEVITVGYDPVAYEVTENGGSVTFTVKVSSPTGGAPRAFTLQLNTADGTAVSPGDYGGQTGPLIQFNTGDVSQTHSILIVDDTTLEDDETFQSTLSLVSGTDVTISAPTATATIEGRDASGQPGITGTPQVGQTLTATDVDMADDDNLPSGVFPTGYSFQWVRVNSSNVETDISGATSSTYVPVAADVGNTIKVKASFTDGGGAEESLASDTYPARGYPTPVIGPAKTACPADANWCTTMTVEYFDTGGSGDAYGFSSITNASFGDLVDADFDQGGTTVELDALYIGDTSSDDVVFVSTENGTDVAVGSIFDLGGAEFTVDASTVPGQYDWDVPANFGWSEDQEVTVSLNLVPLLDTAVVDGDELVLTYYEDLDTNSKPAPSAFSVSVDGTAAAPSSVDTISGKTVTMTLASAATSGQTVTVTYTVPTSNPLQDESELDAPAFTGQSVTNNTGVTNTAPTVANAIPDQLAIPGAAFSYAFPANTFADAESDPLTYTATKADDSALPTWLSFTAGTRTFAGAPAATDAGTLSVKVTASDGAASVSDTFDIKVAATDVCNRTPQVRDAIVAFVSVTDCADLTPADLAAIHAINISSSNISSLQAGDFAGLTGLQWLHLNGNSLSSLPDGIFDGLTALRHLDLNTTLLLSLPDGVFDDLTALEGLFLYNNRLPSLPPGIFDPLTRLTELYLYNNTLSSLPDNIFDPLTALTDLQLQSNAGAPFSPTASAGADQSVVTGTSVTLAGTVTGAWGDNVTWQWTQVAGPASDTEVTSGAVTLDDDAIAAPSFTAPATSATLHFKLVVTPHPGADTSAGRASAADRVTVTVASTDATLSDLDLTWDDSGTETAVTLNPAFATTTTAYTASVANGVSRITVAPTANDGNADCCDFLDDTDSALTDADTNTTGFQVDLDEGDNTIKVVVTAEDDNTTATYTVTVTRAGANNAPTVANAIPDQTATVDAPFSYAFPANAFEDADGDNLTYTATKADDSVLPSWLNFTAGTRTFAGTPTLADAGTFSVKVTASDGTASVSDTFDIRVAATNTAPTVANAIPDQTAIPGATFSYAFPANTFADAESDPLTYTATKADDSALPTWLSFTAGTRTFAGAPAATDAGTLSVKVTASDGTASVSDEFDIEVAATDVCNRTPQVRDAIVDAVSGVTDCADVTPAHLAAIDYLAAYRAEISSLKAGDFAGLTALEELDLTRNDLTSLPAGIFDDLAALEFLILTDNDLSSLPADVFDPLTALAELYLDANSLTTLLVGIFDELTAMTDLFLFDNSLSSLPAGIFDDLSALSVLNLEKNSLSSLPNGVFDNLATLTELNLHDNNLWPLPADIFDGLATLNILVLDDNGLSSLPAGIFDELGSLFLLNLSENDLSSLPDDVLHPLNALGFLVLHTNPGAPFSPTASAGADQSVKIGEPVTLAGTATGAWGDNVTWQWTQVDGPASDTEVTSGAVTLDDDEIAGPSFTAPATAATLHFKLVVTPRQGVNTVAGYDSGADWVTVEATANTPATGAPEITGAPQVGQTLTATAGDMADGDNLPTTTFPQGYSFQWARVDSSSNESDIGTSSHEYDPVAADVGYTIKVKVTFTDGGGNEETLTSDATAAVVAAPGACPAGNDWCATMTVGELSQISTLHGYRSGTGGAFGSLDDTGIEFGGETWTVSGLYFSDGAVTDSYSIDLDAFVPRGSVFDLGGTVLTADASSEKTTSGQYEWNTSTHPGWVDGQKVTVSANLAPVMTHATVNGDRLVLTFAEDLDPTSRPAASAFTVSVDGATGAAPSSVDTITGRQVTLTLASAVTSGQTVTVSYAPPGTSPLRDASGLAAPAFTGRVVTITPTTATDATLSALALTDGEGAAITLAPPFASGTKTYTASVADAVDEITIAPTANDGNAKWDILDAGDTVLTDADADAATGFQVALAEGANTIKVRVTAEDDTTTDTYTVTVTRAVAVLPGGSVLVSTLGQDLVAAAFVGNGNIASQRFTVGADKDYTLTDVTVFALSNGGIVGVALHAVDGSNPAGTALHTLTAPPGTSTGPRTFTAPAGATLVKGTSYFVVVTGPSGTELWVGTTGSDTEDAASLSGWSVANDGRRLVSGSWSDDPHVLLMSLGGVQKGTATTTTANTAAGGRPGITGTPQVGRTLTAELGTIDDDDGLPATTFPQGYTFQWYRVDADGTSNRTAITGATGATHTLAAGDENAKVVVEVSFADAGGNAEGPLASEAYPAGTATVTAPGQPASVLLDTTLTVGGAGSYRGCSTPNSYGPCEDKMAPRTFVSTDAGGATREFTIRGLHASDFGAGELAIWFEDSKELRDYDIDNLALELDGTQFRFRSADAGLTIKRLWRNAGLDWNIGDTVAVRILDLRVAEQEAAEPLTVEVQGAPESHDGANPITFRLAFSEDVAVEPDAMRDHALLTSGGTVTSAARVDGRSDLWELTIEPAGNGPVGIVVPKDRACTEPGALCTSEGQGVSESVAHSIPWVPPAQEQQADPDALTAAFEDVPEEHDGSSPFILRLAFSEAPRLSFRTLRDEALTATGGTVKRARRAVKGQDRLWDIHVEPAGNGAVTVALAATAPCGEPGAICTAGGKALANAPAATVQGPPGLAVAGAEAREGPGAALEFAVTLSRASAATVTVDYATSDETAAAGADYTATAGTLTFLAGETAKTVAVPVIDDVVDEGTETLTLTLANPAGGNAWLADATATGTIRNSGLMPQAWLARFGRTVAEQIVDAVQDRLQGPPAPGVQVTLAGERIGGAAKAGDEEDPGAARRKALEEAEAKRKLAALSAWLHGEAGAEGPDRRAEYRAVEPRALLTGSAFQLTTRADGIGGGLASLWGRGAFSSFDGRDGELSVSGEVNSALVGADWTGGPGSRDKAGAGKWTAGLMLSHARGTGRYRGASGDGPGRTGGGGEVESTVTGLYPYGRYRATDRVTVWGTAGYGAGTLTLTPDPAEGADPGARRARLTDMDLMMAAGGLRGTVVKAPADGGPEVAVETDALAVRTRSEARHAGAQDGGSLAAATGDATRLRLGLEGTWRGLALGGGTLEPRLELGLRHDGGDAETGFGLDAGAGLAWAHPRNGLRLQLSGRGLLSHESRGFREQGVAGSLSWHPRPERGRGPKLTLTRTLGGASSGGAGALLGQRTLAGLGANDTGDPLESRRLEVGFGYGFAVLGDRFTSTPEIGLGMSNGHREYRLGWRLTLARSGTSALEFALEASWREAANDNGSGPGAEPEHALGLRLTARW